MTPPQRPKPEVLDRTVGSGEKKQYQRYEKLIRHWSPVWQERLWLAHFEIENVFLDASGGWIGSEEFTATAVCNVRWNYMMAKIQWFSPSAIKADDRSLEETLVHELCHVLLSPEQDLLDDRFRQKTADEEFTEVEADLLVKEFYERMEMATENVSRMAIRAHGLIGPDGI